MITSHRKRESKYIRPQDRMREGMLIWLSFWRVMLP